MHTYSNKPGMIFLTLQLRPYAVMCRIYSMSRRNYIKPSRNNHNSHFHYIRVYVAKSLKYVLVLLFFYWSVAKCAKRAGWGCKNEVKIMYVNFGFSSFKTLLCGSSSYSICVSHHTRTRTAVFLLRKSQGLRIALLIATSRRWDAPVVVAHLFEIHIYYSMLAENGTSTKTSSRF